jgi:hypothetical protein
MTGSRQQPSFEVPVGLSWVSTGSSCPYATLKPDFSAFYMSWNMSCSSSVESEPELAEVFLPRGVERRGKRRGNLGIKRDQSARERKKVRLISHSVICIAAF